MDGKMRYSSFSSRLYPKTKYIIAMYRHLLVNGKTYQLLQSYELSIILTKVRQSTAINL